MKKTIAFVLNGERRVKDIDISKTLLDSLRDDFGLKSVKCSCDRGDCGSCTVFFNGKTLRSCLVLAVEADEQEVMTLEGLMKNGLTPLQKAFLKNNSFQCGFCAPGMILSAEEILRKYNNPTEEEIKEGIAGNLCRCTGYFPIINAIKEVADNKGENL